MTGQMDSFYTIVDKTLVEDILNRDGEYCIRVDRQNHDMKRLLASLDHNIAALVDDLLTEQLAIGELRECACFRAGFRIALELVR